MDAPLGSDIVPTMLPRKNWPGATEGAHSPRTPTKAETRSHAPVLSVTYLILAVVVTARFPDSAIDRRRWPLGLEGLAQNDRGQTGGTWLARGPAQCGAGLGRPGLAALLRGCPPPRLFCAAWPIGWGPQPSCAAGLEPLQREFQGRSCARSK